MDDSSSLLNGFRRADYKLVNKFVLSMVFILSLGLVATGAYFAGIQNRDRLNTPVILGTKTSTTPTATPSATPSIDY